LEEELRQRGQGEVSFHTFHYIEGSPTGGNLLPRLVGFTREEDLRFFELLLRVKGLGIRKALRALRAPVAEVAAAIEAGDTASLARLPELGRRTADRVVAELRGKVGAFADGHRLLGSRARQSSRGEGRTSEGPEGEALAVLLRLGFRPPEAESLVEKALGASPEGASAEELLRLALRQVAQLRKLP
ncbi:MAG: Holliday junction branch migration protein RuvA, partial [Nitrospinota bacterium]